ncbi:MAG: hypothetical protein HC941_08195 [Microcoleus sp. SU_5_3]|nr:hypothetical protein [Microcoleus sp. SU_5_3]
MRRYEQLSLLLADLIATHHTNYNGDGKPGFGISRDADIIEQVISMRKPVSNKASSNKGLIRSL